MHRKVQQTLPKYFTQWLLCVAFFAVCLILLNPVKRLINIDIDFTQHIGIFLPISSAQWQDLYEAYTATVSGGFADSVIEYSRFRSLYIFKYIHQASYILFFTVIFGGIVRFYKMQVVSLLLKVIGTMSLIYGIGIYIFATVPYNIIAVDSLYFIPFEILFLITIYGYIVWQLLQRSSLKKTSVEIDLKLKKLIFISVHIMGLALMFGTFVASLNAGFMYNDFPLMAGEFMPSNYLELSPFITNFFENHANVQFNHRILGYITAFTAFWLYKKSKSYTLCPIAKKAINIWCAVIALQILMGVLTLISSVHFHTAITHQFVMICAVTSGLYIMHVTHTKKYNA